MEETFAERIAAIKERQTQTGGKSAATVLSEAQEGLLYSRDFFNAIGEADTLGIAYLRNTLGYPPAKATRGWYAKPWQYQVDEITSLANAGDETAKRILETVQLFTENALLAQTLQTVIDEIGRPSRMIYNETQFNGLLGDLVQKGLALELPAPPGWRKSFKMKRVMDGKEKNLYYTATSIVKARISWPFVLKALGRVRAFAKTQQEVLSKIEPLMEGATLGSNPEEQTLQQLLTFTDKVGFILIWDDRTRIWKNGKPEDAGLLATLIGRHQPNSNLILSGWIANNDNPLALPANEDYELPPLMASTRLDMGLEIGFQQARLKKDEWESVMRIQHLIRRWMTLEGKFQVRALPKPQPVEQAK